MLPNTYRYCPLIHHYSCFFLSSFFSCAPSLLIPCLYSPLNLSLSLSLLPSPPPPFLFMFPLTPLFTQRQLPLTLISGLKFYITADNSHPNLDVTLRTVYEVYTDYVLKNPFYEIEMPIRCELFDINLDKMFQTENRSH
jgi:hypothetical protein